MTGGRSLSKLCGSCGRRAVRWAVSVDRVRRADCGTEPCSADAVRLMAGPVTFEPVCTVGDAEPAAVQRDAVLEWLETVHAEGVIVWASPEALIARRRHELGLHGRPVRDR